MREQREQRGAREPPAMRLIICCVSVRAKIIRENRAETIGLRMFSLWKWLDKVTRCGGMIKC